MKYLFLLFLFFFGFKAANAQQDTVALKKDSFKSYSPRYGLDSAALAQKAHIKDSLTLIYLKPNPNRANLFTDSLLKEVVTTDKYLLSAAKSVKIKKNNYGLGINTYKLPLWFIMSIITLVALFGILKIIFKKEVDLIFSAFYDNRALNQINKEDNVFVSWQFLFLYLIFSLTVGLFTCVIIFKVKSSSLATDFYTYLIVSFFVCLFFGLKILVLRFLGFLFKVQKLVRDYTNIIYLTYFNVLFILLPITFCLSLINIQEQYYAFWSMMLMLSGIIAFQFLRITLNILLSYRLSKFYLILYLCALEICPILIFAKTINISL